MKKNNLTLNRHFFSFLLIIVFNTSLSAQLTGDVYTPANFSNDNTDYLIDGTLQFSNTGTITDVTVNISEGFQSGDKLQYYTESLPAGVTVSNNVASGVLTFTGTASVSDWNVLLKSIYFRTTSADLSDRKITFSTGSLPASAEGHFYKLSSYQAHYYEVPDYIPDYEPSLSAYMGLQGYPLNISSIAENEFLKNKMSANFWLPLSDEYYMLNNMLGFWNYNDQSGSEGNFYWLTGPLTGTNVSSCNNGAMTPQAGVYNNWASGQPDNNGLYGNGSYFNVSNGKWYDESFYDNHLNYVYKNLVIEYGGMLGDPVLNTVFTKTMSYLMVLPVTMVSFDVKKENNNVLTEWETIAERNNCFFNIERSADNQQFSTIGKINSSGNTNNLKRYRFVDRQPLSGVSYYRLKQVDMNGNFSYSAIKRIEFNNTEATNHIYPAIASNTINVQLKNDVGITCYVINSAGAIVQQIKPSGISFTIPVASLARGVYIFNIVDGNGNQDNLRFIKQ